MTAKDVSCSSNGSNTVSPYEDAEPGLLFANLVVGVAWQRTRRECGAFLAACLASRATGTRAKHSRATKTGRAHNWKAGKCRVDISGRRFIDMNSRTCLSSSFFCHYAPGRSLLAGRPEGFCRLRVGG
jgi:hypothetical protein